MSVSPAPKTTVFPESVGLRVRIPYFKGGPIWVDSALLELPAAVEPAQDVARRQIEPRSARRSADQGVASRKRMSKRG
jgi:hypothetical protein